MVVEQQAVVCTEWDIACPGRLNRMMRSIARAKKSRPRSVGSPPCQAMLPRRSGAFRAIGGYRIPASPRTCASGRRDRASSSTEGSNNHSVYAGRAARLCHEVECGDPRPSSEGTRALIVRRRQVYHETKILLRWCEGLRPIAAKVSCDRRSSCLGDALHFKFVPAQKPRFLACWTVPGCTIAVMFFLIGHGDGADKAFKWNL